MGAAGRRTVPTTGRLAGLLAARRAAVAPMMAIMAPALLGMTALIVDTGFWINGSTRLQVAADAGAMGAGFLLNTNLKASDAATQSSTFQTVALYEARAAATKLTGTLITPITVSPSADWSSVTVTITSQAPSFFGNVFKVGAPVLRATATAGVTSSAPPPCLLTLGTTGTGITVDNSGTISAASCSIFSNAKDPNATIPSIYLNSGTISGNSIGAAGNVTQSNSGSNTYNPTTQQSGAAPATDQYAGKTIPAAGSCNVTNGNYSSYGTYSFDAASNGGSYVFCGNTTFGGNGSTDSFSAGTYYVVNGDLTFNNASLSNASNISFVMTGSSPGNFSWTNYSNTSTPFAAPTTGPMTGIAIWQACNSSGNQTASFQGGSTLVISGSVYMPCSSVDAGNNAQLQAPLNKAFDIISKKLYVHGSAGIRTAAGSGSTATAGPPVLTQ